MGLLALLKIAYVRIKHMLLFRFRMMVAGLICGWIFNFMPLRDFSHLSNGMKTIVEDCGRL